MSDTTYEDLPEQTTLPTEDLVSAATMLLLAAILLRDMAGAMPPQFLATMPDDIRDRLMDHHYQDAFDALPEDIRNAAREFATTNPYLLAARARDGN